MTENDSSSGRSPLGGRAGVTLVALSPFVAALIFVILGFTLGAWAWAWVFFLLIPIAGVIVYGPGRRN